MSWLIPNVLTIITGVSFTMPRIGSADSVLLRCAGRMFDTSLGSGCRQSRDLPVDGKKLVIR